MQSPKNPALHDVLGAALDALDSDNSDRRDLAHDVLADLQNEVIGMVTVDLSIMLDRPRERILQLLAADDRL